MDHYFKTIALLFCLEFVEKKLLQTHAFRRSWGMVGGRVDGTGGSRGRVNRYHPKKASAFIKSAVFGLRQPEA